MWVTDANGCTSTDEIQVTVHELPQLDAGADVNLCAGDCYTFNPTGGGGSPPYDFSWSSGSVTVCPAGSTTYWVTLTDSEGCSATDEVTINVTASPQASAGGDINLCVGECYTLEGSAQGGQGPYDYNWSSGTEEVCPTETTTYTLTVTDANGCSSTDEITITVNDLPQADAGADVNLCLGDCYSLNPSATGGSGEYQYNWSSGTGEVCPTATTSYTLTVTDSNGCSTTDDLTITVHDLPAVNAGTDMDMCPGECFTFTPAGSGGTAPYTFEWDTPETTVCPTQNTIYSVTLTDANGCSATDDITITVLLKRM